MSDETEYVYLEGGDRHGKLYPLNQGMSETWPIYETAGGGRQVTYVDTGRRANDGLRIFALKDDTPT